MKIKKGLMTNVEFEIFYSKEDKIEYREKTNKEVYAFKQMTSKFCRQMEGITG